ncbi:MAG: redox-regulated ATPase YchF, partial [Dehalococcoidia bacterium]
MELGIIGLPKSGKTTVLNALTRGRAETSPSSPASGRPNLGVAKVRDPRLDALAAMFQPERVIQAEVRYTDIPGAPEGLGKDQGIGGEYLNILQRADAIFHVVRAFDDPSVPHVAGSVAPYQDTVTMNLELAFSDLAILERRVQRLDAEFKGARGQDRERMHREAALLERLKEGLAQDIPVREQDLSVEDRRLISAYQFLTAKPLLILFNIGEDQLPQAPTLEEEMSQRLNRSGVLSATMCATLEAELAQMEPEEEEEFRQSLGGGEPGATRMIRLSYELLGLISFFTTASREVKAWSVPRDAPASRAAGHIHSDMERGFIRAEVIGHDDLARCGSIAEARRQGLLRLEGRTYPVKDGDVITFL